MRSTWFLYTVHQAINPSESEIKRCISHALTVLSGINVIVLFRISQFQKSYNSVNEWGLLYGMIVTKCWKLSVLFCGGFSRGKGPRHAMCT